MKSDHVPPREELPGAGVLSEGFPMLAAPLHHQTQRPVIGVLTGCVLVALMDATWVRGKDDLDRQLPRLTEDCRRSKNSRIFCFFCNAPRQIPQVHDDDIPSPCT